MFGSEIASAFSSLIKELTKRPKSSTINQFSWSTVQILFKLDVYSE